MTQGFELCGVGAPKTDSGVQTKCDPMEMETHADAVKWKEKGTAEDEVVR